MSDVQNGDLVKDSVTGFQGIVTDITTWLHGCDRAAVQPQELNKDGKPQAATTFDVLQLEIIQKQAVTYVKRDDMVDIKLGDKVRDTITGLTGVMISETRSLFEVARGVQVQPQELKDGAVRDSEWFLETRLEKVVDKAVQSDVREPKKRTGGPRDECYRGPAGSARR